MAAQTFYGTVQLFLKLVSYVLNFITKAIKTVTHVATNLSANCFSLVSILECNQRYNIFVPTRNYDNCLILSYTVEINRFCNSQYTPNI